MLKFASALFLAFSTLAATAQTPIPTQTRLYAYPAAPRAGAPVALGAVVTSVSTVPDGTVTFRAGATTLGVSPRLAVQSPATGRISAGRSHTCAIAALGEVFCWGNNGFGKLGNGLDTDTFVPTPVVGLGAPAIEVAVGDDHSCALLTGGTVWCWGDNSSYQLGADRAAVPSSPRPRQVRGLSGVQHIGAGALHSCAVMGNQAVRCWGNNLFGQLGDGTRTSRPAPHPVTNLRRQVVQVVAGETSTCALMSSGYIYCWGGNQNGELGAGDFASSNTPRRVRSSVPASFIASGPSHSCAIFSNARLRCWGFNGNGQIGNGSELSAFNTPTAPFQFTAPVVNVAAGASNTCAVRQDGDIYCWGFNGRGQLGNGFQTSSAIPVETLMPTSGQDAILALGRNYACAMAIDGHSWCWGDNESRQLGAGEGRLLAETTPVPVSGGSFGWVNDRALFGMIDRDGFASGRYVLRAEYTPGSNPNEQGSLSQRIAIRVRAGR